MGFAVPELALQLALQEPKYDAWLEQLEHMLAHYYQVGRGPRGLWCWINLLASVLCARFSRPARFASLCPQGQIHNMINHLSLHNPTAHQYITVHLLVHGHLLGCHTCVSTATSPSACITSCAADVYAKYNACRPADRSRSA
jgi:hypothetical protein